MALYSEKGKGKGVRFQERELESQVTSGGVVKGEHSWVGKNLFKGLHRQLPMKLKN